MKDHVGLVVLLLHLKRDKYGIGNANTIVLYPNPSSIFEGTDIYHFKNNASLLQTKPFCLTQVRNFEI